MNNIDRKNLLLEVQKRVFRIVESTKKIEFHTAELVEMFRLLEKKSNNR